MDEAIVTAVVRQSPAQVFEVLTTFFIARVDKIQLAGFVADCADEAHALGLDENERMFRLAELTFGGGSLGTPETAEQCTSHVSLILAAYRAQKSLNMHRAPLPPMLEEAKPEVLPEVRDPVPVEAPALEMPALEPTNESMIQPAANDVPTEAAPEVIVHVGEEPQVRRRQTTKRGAKKKT